MLAAQAFDFVMIDMEHAPMSAEQMTHMVHGVVAASKGICRPIVRVPSHDVEWCKWALDSGAAGIIIPMVNNAAEMESIISHSIYPPRGKRSFGPFNAAFGRQLLGTEFGSYYDMAQNGGVAILPIIESAEGLANAEAIMAVRGVSGAFIGPYDLRLSLGLPGGVDGPEPEFQNALSTIVDAATKHGKVVGSMATSPEMVRRRTERGMTFLLVTLDYNVLVSGFASAVKDAKEAIKEVSLPK
jgi:2-keto-3-deoxy-L-rhamnonate aldolase RhmA